MSFYTSVVKSGNNLFHRYIKDGKRYTEIVKEFDYELYMRSDYSNDSIDVYKIKCKIIESTYVIKDCAVAKCEENESATRISCVQAADELLDIKNIRASFVIFKNENGVNISARSLGDVNVQVIMESFGGGGHQTMAAAHVPGATIDEVEEKLKEFININL